jgi:hypothetical protein
VSAGESTERLSLESFCAECGLHPDFVRKLVDLGLIEADEDGTETWLDRREITRIARAQRLHDGLSLNWVAVGVVLDLLDRIDALEDEVERLRALARRG